MDDKSHRKFDSTKGYPGEGPSDRKKSSSLALTRDLMHRSFDSTLGFPGEGPAASPKVQSKRKAPHTILESTGNREFVLEGPSDDECAADLTKVMGDAALADTSGLWTGDDMAAIGDMSKQDSSLVGTLNFFNIDGIKFGAGAVDHVVRENMKTNCLVSSIVDHRSDWVNVRSRVEQAFMNSYGGPSNVRFSHSCTKSSARKPGIGECSVAVMPALRSRANKCIRDGREWGRYAGVVIEGKMHEGVQHKIAVVCVYAACGKDSSAGETQQRAIDAMQRGKCESERRVARGKSPFTMLLHDLEVVIRELQHDGCTVVVGGDFNQRREHRRGWDKLTAWRKRLRLGDVLEELHPGKKFVTYRANGKIDGVTKKQKRIATWIDHCFASHLLLSNHVICAAGVLDLGKHWHGAKLANSMHNMLCIGIDFGRALHLDSLAVSTDPAAPTPTRMRYIHNETKRAEYAKTIEEGMEAAAVTDMVRVASEMLPNLEAAKERAGLRLNMPPDAPGLRMILDDGSGSIDTITGIVHRNMGACMGVEESESEVERVRKEILAAILMMQWKGCPLS